jgi:tetratricopeptide (TPR) repeat protein
MNLAQAYGNMGDYSRVEPLLLQALEIQTAVRNRWEEMFVLNELGILYTSVGQYAKAFTYLDEAMDRSRMIESEIGAAYILCNLGQAQRDAGRLAEAQVTLASGLALAQSQGELNLQAIYQSDLALASLLARDWHTAVTQAQRALALFAELEQPLATTVIHAAAAAAQLALGDRGAAAASVRAALTLLDACGGEGPDFPHRDYWLCAQTLAALGQAAEAQRARTEAAALLRSRAERISDHAMRATYLAQVALHAEITAAVPA